MSKFKKFFKKAINIVLISGMIFGNRFGLANQNFISNRVVANAVNINELDVLISKFNKLLDENENILNEGAVGKELKELRSAFSIMRYNTKCGDDGNSEAVDLLYSLVEDGVRIFEDILSEGAGNAEVKNSLFCLCQKVSENSSDYFCCVF